MLPAPCVGLSDVWMLCKQGLFDLAKDLGAAIWLACTGQQKAMDFSLVKGNVWAFGIGLVGWTLVQYQKAGTVSEGTKKLLRPIADIASQVSHSGKGLGLGSTFVLPVSLSFGNQLFVHHPYAALAAHRSTSQA